MRLKLIIGILIFSGLSFGAKYTLETGSKIMVTEANAIDGGYTNTVDNWVSNKIANASGGGGSSAVETTNIVDGLILNKLDKTGDTAGTLTVTNLTAVESINDYVGSNFKAGYYAGYSANGTYNSYLGYYAGNSAIGNYNAYLGNDAGYFVIGNYNTYLGNEAGYFAIGTYNSYLGKSAGYSAIGDNNSYLGYNAGRYSVSTNNLYLGAYAGKYQTNSNKAYFGDFTTIDINTAKVINVSAGVDNNDAVIVSQLTGSTNAVLISAKGYTDSATNLCLQVAGGTMTGGIDMDSKVIENAGLSGAYLDGAFNANGEKINSLERRANITVITTCGVIISGLIGFIIWVAKESLMKLFGG